MKVNTERAGGAVNQALKQALRDAPEGADQSYFDGVAVAIADAVGAVFERRIRAALRRAGVELPDGPVSVASLLAVVRDRSGLDIQTLTPEGIREAVEARLRAAVVDAVGVDLDLTQGRAAIVQQAAAAALESGRPNKLIGPLELRRLRSLAAGAALGLDVTPKGLRAAQVRIAQRKYRARNKFQWVKR